MADREYCLLRREKVCNHMLTRTGAALIVVRWHQPRNERGAGECRLTLSNTEHQEMRMKRILPSSLAAAMLAASILPSTNLAQEKKPLRLAHRPVSRERHPEMRAAIGALQAARSELEHADTDFGGYKKDAIESVNNALKQLRLALQFDKH
jgi:hypothetical protein